MLSGHVQFKNGVDLIEVKSEKTSGQAIRPIKIKDKNSSAFLSHHGHLVFKLVLYALDISSPEMKSLC